MDNEKIGLFIKRLREEKNYTQEELAKLIPIGRGAVSKWERGVTIPDSMTLIKLSEIFDVSINEILAGKRLNKENKKEIDNVALKYYTKSNKLKKYLIISLLITIVVMFSFLLYYFCILYKSIGVYRITGKGYNFEIIDGLFVNTNYSKYLRIDDLKYTEDFFINKLNLYYLDKDKQKVDIYTTNGDNIILNAIEGYNVYFDKNNVKYVIQNMYLDINYNDNLTETIKVQFDEDYINDELFFKKEEKLIDSNNVIQKQEKSDLVKSIEENFIEENGLYSYVEEEKDYINEFIYNPTSNEILLTLNECGNIVKEWNYQIDFEILDIFFYKGDNILYEITAQKESVECVTGICEEEEKSISYFWDTLNKILQRA